MGRPVIKAFSHVSLSVRDLPRSLVFYRDVMGLAVLAEPFEGGAFQGREAMLMLGRTALCLQEHAANAGDPFSATRTGLDHLAFHVASREALDEWAATLSEAGVPHSGVQPLSTYGFLIAFEDPDGIQLELHWPGE